MIGITKNQDGLLYKGLNKNEGLRFRQTQEYNDSVLAALNGREQLPQLKSNQDKIIVKFN